MAGLPEPWRLPAHMLFELLGFAAAFVLLRYARARGGDPLPSATRWALAAAALVGAALGSKLLHHLAHPSELAARLADPRALLPGKSMVGALLGGWGAVELAKRRLGVRRRTGDVYALPLAVGIAVGRVGCLLAGPADGTHGSPAHGPWQALALDLGDGVLRHPVLLYEIAFLALLAWVATRPAWWRREGQRFRLVALGYLAFRLGIDFLKPAERLAGLGVIQWACVLGLLAALPWRPRSGRAELAPLAADPAALAPHDGARP
jgi:prolipoprotein diacylglyceryltransferase